MDKASHKKWKLVSLSSVLERIRIPVSVKRNKQYTEIGVRSHGKGIFHKEPKAGHQIGNKKVFQVVPDCFVFNVVFAWEQAVAKTVGTESGMIASHRFPMFRPVKEALELDYLLYYFKSPYGKHQLGLASPGGAGRNRTLSQAAFLKLRIPLPPLEEQNRISNLLNQWSNAVSLHDQALALKQSRRNSLLYGLLRGNASFASGDVRSDRLLGQIPAKWKTIPLGEICDKVKRKNTIGETHVLTASGSYGLVDQREYFNRSVAGQNLAT